MMMMVMMVMMMMRQYSLGQTVLCLSLQLPPGLPQPRQGAVAGLGVCD